MKTFNSYDAVGTMCLQDGLGTDRRGHWSKICKLSNEYATDKRGSAASANTAHIMTNDSPYGSYRSIRFNQVLPI